MSQSKPGHCAHGNPVNEPPDCPECAAMVERAAKRIADNGGVSPRRERQRRERLGIKT